VAKSILRKSTLSLILVLLTAGTGKTFAQTYPPLPPTQPSPDDDPGGGNPVPTGPSLMAIHLT